jgi:hypothetical protein
VITETEIINAIKKIVPEPIESQDPLDMQAAELRVATIIAKIASARKEHATDTLKVQYADKVKIVQEFAKANMLKGADQLQGKHFTVIISANAPARRTDGEALYNELIKAGIDRTVLDAAYKKSIKLSAPATSLTVVEHNNE